MSSRLERRFASTVSMRCLTTLVLVLAVFASVAWPTTATATEIAFDTFGPGDSYDGDFRYGSGQAFLFEPTQSGPLSSITVALGRQTTSTTETTFELFEDANLNFGSLLETFNVANATPLLPSPGMVVTFDSVVQPILLAGHSYWLNFSDPEPFVDSYSLWFFNDQGIGGTRLSNTDLIATLPAFRVTVVPEPSAGLLLMIGLVVLAVLQGSRYCIRSRAGPQQSPSRATLSCDQPIVRLLAPNRISNLSRLPKCRIWQ